MLDLRVFTYLWPNLIVLSSICAGGIVRNTFSNVSLKNSSEIHVYVHLKLCMHNQIINMCTYILQNIILLKMYVLKSAKHNAYTLKNLHRKAVYVCFLNKT